MAWGLVLLALVASGPQLFWRMDFSPAYIDNLFEYSPSEIDSLLAGVNPDRYRVNSVDDVDLSFGLRGGLRWQAAGKPGSLALRSRIHNYAVNPAKSYAVTATELTQQLWTGGSVRLTGQVMPDRLIRHYRPRGSSRYEECRFSERLLGLRCSQQLRRLGFGCGLVGQYDDYATRFDYYDTRLWRLQPEVEWRPRENLIVGLRGEYRVADARGPVPDVSYQQQEIGVSVETRPMRFNRLAVVGDYSWARRRFTTANPAETDPAHAGRLDELGQAGIELRWQPVRRVGVRLGYAAEWRSVVRANDADIDEVKNYRKNTVSAAIVLTGESR